MEALTIHALHEKLIKGEISACELTAKYLAHKDVVEPQVKAFLSDNREGAAGQVALHNPQKNRH